MSDQTWLQSLKVGDEVALYFGSVPTIRKIERETATTWVLHGGTKIRKSDGRAIGMDNGWGSGYWAYEATDKRRAEWGKGQLQHRIESNRKPLTLDQLRRIVAILDEPTPDPQEASRT